MIFNDFNFSFSKIILDREVSLILISQGTLFVLILCVLFLVYYLIRKEKSLKLKIDQINLYQIDLEEKEKELNELREELNKTTDLIQVKERKDQKLLLNLIKANDPLFLEKFKEMYPEFVEMLYNVNSTLTQNDLKYCILIKYNFSSKEIGDILNVSANSVGVKRHRIREKLQITSKIRLNEWLNAF